ncbi:MAG: TAT-variant-translocated molybdopterin oxidoreductase [Candidatus Latescibacterota bacterium]|nr:TAT-variant-translocated molybdopterin oxidoreductase [Candidatus Latescibacterota bacterium]
MPTSQVPLVRIENAPSETAAPADKSVPGRKQLDIAQLRQRLEKQDGPSYWRSLEELSQSPEFTELLHREFPENATEWADGFSRRNFIKLMGASLAFGGLTACTIQPDEKIVPWVRAPENLIPGKPLYYASAASFGGIGTGILVESHMGRPTKVEGNPDHPSNLGSSDAVLQASILDLYDPDRAQAVTNAGHISTWGRFVQALSQHVEILRLKHGEGLRILTGAVTSPTLGRQLQTLLKALPKAGWHQYDPAHNDNAIAGSQLAFGRALDTVHDLARAKIVVSLDADFMQMGPAAVRHARDFMQRRSSAVKSGADAKSLNRLYTVEVTPSATGSVSDHRAALDSGRIEAFAAGLAQALGASMPALIRRSISETGNFEDPTGWIPALAEDLRANRGASVVMAGAQQSAEVHALAHVINNALGNVGSTVHYIDPIEVEPTDHDASLRRLVDDMNAGEVEALVILGVNPVYEAPSDVNFASALDKVDFRVQLSSHQDETSKLSHWHVPESHYLEGWSDVRSFDGTATIVQPLIQPLYNSRSAHDLLAVLGGQGGKPVLDIVKETWSNNGALGSGDFDRNWQIALHNGLVDGTRGEAQRVSLQSLSLPSEFGQPLDAEEATEVLLRPDAYLGTGRNANNGWLQETPRPITKLTWDNAALVSPITAQRLGVSNQQVLTITAAGNTLAIPAWIVPGQADGVVVVHLGYGREAAGHVGNGVGANANRIRSTGWKVAGATVAKTFDKHPLACTQDHYSMEGRHLVRHADAAHYRAHPNFAHEEAHEFPAELTLYDSYDYQAPNQGGMTIDLSACIGCNACSVACQSENNIPIVGKDEVLNAREMSWIRIDRYYTDVDDPEILHQPIPCQQCENAPCELVCPVTATSHSEEGLNDMVYNRCVGTRYCSNNCVYKVRRFNFLQYSDRETESLKLQRNPDVTVRSRGVMEKCTYCVQRINAARIDTKKSGGGAIPDGAVQTACQQACPTQAIAFGNVADPESQVSQLKATKRNYGILTELNTKPRTTYLARVNNPNPDIRS